MKRFVFFCLAFAGCKASVPTAVGSVVASWDAKGSSYESLHSLAEAARTLHESPFTDSRSGVAVRFKFATAEDPRLHSPVPVHVEALLEGNPGGWTVTARMGDPLALGELPGGRRDVALEIWLSLTRRAPSEHLFGTAWHNETLLLVLHANGFVHQQSVAAAEGPRTPEGTVLAMWDVAMSRACDVKRYEAGPVTAHHATFSPNAVGAHSDLVLGFDYETAEEPTEHVPVIVGCLVKVEQNPKGLHVDVPDEGRRMTLYKTGAPEHPEYVLTLELNLSAAEGGATTTFSSTGPMQLHADGTAKDGIPMGTEVR